MIHDAEKIRAAMKKKGLTTEELASKTNVSRQTISGILNGKTGSIETYIAVANELDLTLEEIFPQTANEFVA